MRYKTNILFFVFNHRKESVSSKKNAVRLLNKTVKFSKKCNKNLVKNKLISKKKTTKKTPQQVFLEKYEINVKTR